MRSEGDPDDSGSRKRVAVLVSGGVDSAILCGEQSSRGAEVYPIYVKFGLRWEDVEVGWLRSFLAAIARPSLRELCVLKEPVADVYGRHWSTEGAAVPDAKSADDAVYLPGRNLMLLNKSAIWCHVNGIEAIRLGSLKGNPFPDCTPAFDRAMEAALALGLGASIRIERPYLELTKSEVLQRGAGLPLELTFSCIDPVGLQHCGACNKCAERRRAFRKAAIYDATEYYAPIE